MSEVHIERYQPDRRDILWNTDWGIPQGDLDENEAVSKGLVLYRGRWITKDEKKTLTCELWSYRVVKVVGTLMSVAGWMTLAPVLLLIVQVAVVGGAAAFKALIAGISGLPLAVFFIIYGRALKKFRKWAWVLTVLGLAVQTLSFCALPIVLIVISGRNILEDLAGVTFCALSMAPFGMLLGTALYFMVNRTGRRIFWPPSQNGEPVDQERIGSPSAGGDEKSTKPPKGVVSNQQLPGNRPQRKGSSPKRLSAKEVLADIKSGLDDVALMQKYGLSAKQMASIYDRLAAKGLLKQ